MQGAEQRLYSNAPQICTQVVILAGREAAGEHEPKEQASDIALHTLLPGGQEVTLTRIAC